MDSLQVPRYAGLSTFARLPYLNTVPDFEIAVVGIPFDAGTTYRPGARFGPSHIREASRLLKPYHPYQETAPFETQQVVDAGDIACNPFDIAKAIAQIQTQATDLKGRGRRLIALGGDHTVALPLLRSVAAAHGPVALIHFDAHLDTWDTYFGAPYTHGTPFRRAAEEGLFASDRSIHIGIRGSLYGASDLTDDARLGFSIIHAHDFDTLGSAAIITRIRERVGDSPIYLSIDLDVLDPAHAPGTGTPSVGGLSSRELLSCLRGLRGLPLAGADVVEVAPAYDHGQLTGVAAAEIVFEMVTLMSLADPQVLEQAAAGAGVAQPAAPHSDSREGRDGH